MHDVYIGLLRTCVSELFLKKRRCDSFTLEFGVNGCGRKYTSELRGVFLNLHKVANC